MIYIIFGRSCNIVFDLFKFKQILNKPGFIPIEVCLVIKVFDPIFDFQIKTYLIDIFIASYVSFIDNLNK